MAVRELDTGLRAGTLFVLVVAACSLTVAAVAGLAERRRPFALLRACGMKLGELRTTIMLETALPLITTVLGSAAAGLVVSAALTAAANQHWTAPGLGYAGTLAGELSAAIAITALCLPLIDRTTRHNTVRFD